MKTVLDTESRAFDYPWNENDFINCLRQQNCIGMVAEHGERVLGYTIYELHKSRLRVLNFAVDFDFRRCGIGSQMVHKLYCKLSQQRRNWILLEVRETNTEAQLFFQSLGFRAVRVLHDYYNDTDEAAYLMQADWSPAYCPVPLEQGAT